MKRKRVLLVVMVLAILVVLLLFLPDLRTGSSVPINQALYDGLRLGMTEDEVKAAVPYAPGDHANAHHYGTGFVSRDGELDPACVWNDLPDGSLTFADPVTGVKGTGKWWRGRDGYLVVFFGPEDRLVERRYWMGFAYSRTEWLGYQLRRFLGL